MRAVVVQIRGQVAWRAFRDAVTGLYIGVCDALKLTSRGESWNEMTESSNEIVQLLLTDLLKSGRLREFLQKHEWSLAGSMPAKRANVRFDLPMPFQYEGERRHALSA